MKFIITLLILLITITSCGDKEAPIITTSVNEDGVTETVEHTTEFAQEVYVTLDHMATTTGMKVNAQEVKDLITGIAGVESDLKYRKQFNNGPARGLLQMEENTAYGDAVDYCNRRSKLKAYVEAQFGADHNFSMVENNDKYSIVMCRIYLMRYSEAVPTTLDGQAGYWKKYWNTTSGAGTVEQYLDRWADHN